MLPEEWHDGHKRQIEIYQWLLRQNGFTVSDTGCWVYANASKDKAVLFRTPVTIHGWKERSRK
jgi:hypothetical protein